MKILNVKSFSRLMVFSIGITFCGLAFCSTQTLMVSEGKRLEATISVDAMNRISVLNDRIINIFGDEGTFVTQTDEQTGQIFIKPTIENGSKPLSLTLITENGITQDLSLNPTDVTAATIVLKNLNATQSKNSISNYESLFASNPHVEGSSSQEQFIQIMKQAVKGELPAYNKSKSVRRTVPGVRTSFVKAYQSGPYLVSVWSVKATNKNPEIQEHRFYQPGDFAICLQDRILKNDSKTLLYVLTRL